MSGSTKTLTLELTGKNIGLSRVLSSADGDVKRFQKSVETSNKSMSLSQAAVRGAGAAVTALAAGLSYAIGKAVAFDKAMRNVNSLTKLNEQQFASMEKQVISMSTKLPQSATTLAEGLYDIASSGFQGADGIKVLDAAARSASAGMTSTATSSKAITAVLNAYGLKAKDAADVSDVLFSTVNLGVISFDELANNLGDVVGATAAAKVGIDEVGAAIATMTLSGIKGAQATTSLSSLTTKLVQPSAALAKVYEQLGYKSGAAALETDGLHGVMEKLRVATGGNITTLLQLFPDIEAARGALALMANEGKNYNNVADQITDKTKRMGATQEVLDEQMKSVSAQWQLMVNRVEAAATSIGVSLLPSLLKGMEVTQDWGATIGKFAVDLKGEVGGGLGDLKSSLENVLPFLEKMGAALLSTGKELGGDALHGAVQTFNLLAGALQQVTSFASDNEAVVMALGIAYGVHAVGGITALNKGLDLAGTGLSALSTGASAAYDFIAGLFTPGVAGAADSVTKMGDKAKAAGAKLKSALMVAAPAAAVGGALAVAVMAWQNYSQGAERARSVTKDVQRAMNSFDVDQMAVALSKANDFIQETNDRLTDIGTSNSFSGAMSDFFSFQKNWESVGMVDNLEQVQEKADAAKLAIGQMQYNTLELFKLMGQPMPDAAKWINDVQGANGTKAQTEAMKQMKTVVDQLSPALREAGVDMTKSWDTQTWTNAASAVDKVKTAAESNVGAQKNLVEAVKETSTGLGDAAGAADKLKQALDGLMGASLGVDQAQINWATGLDKLKVTLDKNGASLSYNTTKGLENRQAIIDQVGSLQEVLVASANAGAGQEQLAGQLEGMRSSMIKAGTDAGFTKGEMVKLLATYNLTPELVQTIIKESGAESTKDKMKALADQAKALDRLKPKPKVSAETTVAQSRLNAVQNRLDQIDGRNASASVTVTENTYKNMVETHLTVDKGVRVNADGGVWGSMPSLPKQALIKAGQGNGVYQWAEQETGGEAFIPLAPGKRPRSQEILGQVADRFGLMLVRKMANGGFTYPAFKFDPKGGPRAQQRREWEDKKFAAYEEWKDRRLLAATSAGKYGDGMFRVGATSGDTLTNLGAAKEARAQAAAELAARKSRNPSDSAEDFYKKPTISLKEYLAALKQTATYQRQWNATLTMLAGRVGSDVVDQLQAMGDQGEDIIKKMAKSSVTSMKQMAEQIRTMNFTKFISDTTADVKGHAAFQANLQALVKMGRADLAGRLEQMGYDQGASLAAQAVKSPGSVLTNLNNLLSDQEKYNDPRMSDAFKLAQLIQRSGGKLGVMGLASASGMGIGDVLGLLTGYESQVFGKVPAATMRQIRIDQGLLKAGKQPSGLAYGAIVRGSDTGYFWGEPSSGGESLIPHGLDRRQRARQLWHETGRIIGATASGGGGVNIAPGAVSVQVVVTQAGASRQDIEAAARAAVGDGMNQLVRQLNHGGGR